MKPETCSRRSCRIEISGNRYRWRHTQTDRLYCQSCAFRINKANKEDLVIREAVTQDAKEEAEVKETYTVEQRLAVFLSGLRNLELATGIELNKSDQCHLAIDAATGPVGPKKQWIVFRFGWHKEENAYKVNPGYLESQGGEAKKAAAREKRKAFIKKHARPRKLAKPNKPSKSKAKK